MIKKSIPSFVTSLNLASGFLGIIMAFTNHLEMASILTGFALAFDFADGFLARALHVKSEFGKQIDSLADMVTFGVLPGVIAYQILLKGVAETGADNLSWLPYISVFVAVLSGLRLAKFNIDTRQSDSFIGLPTPANATIIASLPLILAHSNPSSAGAFISKLALNPFFFSAIVIVLALLLVSELPMFSLKHIAKGFKQNKLQYLFLLSAVAMLVFFQFAALPLIILLYILLSVVVWAGKKSK